MITIALVLMLVAIAFAIATFVLLVATHRQYLMLKRANDESERMGERYANLLAEVETERDRLRKLGWNDH